MPALALPSLSPAEAFGRLRRRARPFWLDAASGADGLGRYSFVGCDPARVLVRRVEEGDALAALAEASAASAYAPGVPGPCPQWVGYLGYELRRLCERVPARQPDDLGLPDLWFAEYRAVARFDHATGEALALGADAAAVAALAAALARPAAPVVPPRVGPLRADQAEEHYAAAVRRLLEYILAGDVYEACYTHRFRAALAGDPFGLYLALRRHAPAPLGAFLDLGGAQLLSNSPELFLSFDPRTRRLESRPIKGTRPRGRTAAEDRRRRDELAADEKEIAEHVMIVDLVRSDLGRVAEVGSVAVEGYGRTVTLPTVHHRVSTVAARRRGGVDLAALLRATFPGGSVTGAPKVRAMEIIDELEPCRRGPYCGALGYLGADGGLVLAMAIRTATVRDGELRLHAGGAIVADSDPAREHAETLDKAAAFARAIAALAGSASARAPGTAPAAPAGSPRPG